MWRNDGVFSFVNYYLPFRGDLFALLTFCQDVAVGPDSYELSGRIYRHAE